MILWFFNCLYGDKDINMQNRLRLEPLHKVFYLKRVDLSGEKHEIVTPEHLLGHPQVEPLACYPGEISFDCEEPMGVWKK